MADIRRLWSGYNPQISLHGTSAKSNAPNKMEMMGEMESTPIFLDGNGAVTKKQLLREEKGKWM